MSEAIIIALIGLAGMIVKQYLEFRSLRKHINSRMDELLELTKDKARKEGIAQEKNRKK